MSHDPARVDPRHVSTALENDWVRVIRVKLEPNGVVPRHSHPSSVGIFLTEAHLRNSTAESAPEDVRASPGEVFWFAPTTHTTQNVGRKPAELLIVELQQPPLT